MNITYSDQEIAALVQERKELPYNWRNILVGGNNNSRKLLLTGDNGNKFRIIARLNDIQPLDFSVILTVIVPLSNRDFRLCRYNGGSHEHTNTIENEKFKDFHIHFATERYQQRGLSEDTYARPTNRYNDFHTALNCLIKDTNFKAPIQLTLF